MRPISGPTPITRFRRTRRSPALRALVQENTLTVGDLIWPVFVRDGVNQRDPIGAMPGVDRLSLDLVVKAAEEAAGLGIPAICLFPYTDPALRTEDCAEAWNPENLTNRAIRAIKAAVPEIAVMTDVALDPYNALGHDGLVRDGIILNDETVEALVWMALAQAEAGADILGPSDMMDGRIGAMRAGLESAGHKDVAILSYAAKYASAFYGAVLLLQHDDTDRVISMRHEDIAAELGTAREVVSRLLEAFERRDAIRLSRGRIEIRNEALLRELL